jgi:5-methylcytosine-specific restriction endonuclease McrBC GTP-binding regulatory subunit McrB
VGKTFLARRLAWLLMGHRDASRLRLVQFHQAYAYEDFVQGFRPSEGGGFERRDGVFFDFCKLAEADPRHPYVFVADEINRGNLAKIMGELLTLIEGDKRGPDHALRLAYSRPDEPPFSVPPNLYLLGLMNTADRSLAMVDYALRRRFRFITLEPRFASPKFRTLLEAHGAEPDLVARIIEGMTELNAAIAADKTNLGPGYQVGHSFFVPGDGARCDTAWYRRIVRGEIAPLLRDYWFDDPSHAEEWVTRLLQGPG